MKITCMTIITTMAELLLLCSCQLPDDERCDAPYEWHPDQAACIIPEDTEIPESIDTSMVQDGLGADCWSDSDCAPYAPDGPELCLLDPTDATVMGMCTFTDCNYSTCGGSYECCDCQTSALAASLFTHSLVFCVTPGVSSMLTSAGCNCE